MTKRKYMPVLEDSKNKRSIRWQFLLTASSVCFSSTCLLRESKLRVRYIICIDVKEMGLDIKDSNTYRPTTSKSSRDGQDDNAEQSAELSILSML